MGVDVGRVPSRLRLLQCTVHCALFSFFSDREFRVLVSSSFHLSFFAFVSSLWRREMLLTLALDMFMFSVFHTSMRLFLWHTLTLCAGSLTSSLWPLALAARRRDETCMYVCTSRTTCAEMSCVQAWVGQPPLAQCDQDTRTQAVASGGGGGRATTKKESPYRSPPSDSQCTYSVEVQCAVCHEVPQSRSTLRCCRAPAHFVILHIIRVLL